MSDPESIDAESIAAESFAAEPIIFLSHSTDAIEDSHILMILRNMAGEEIPIAVRKTAIFWDVRHYVAIQMGLPSSDIHLVLKNKNPAESEYIQLEDLMAIHTQQLLLEANDNIVHLLVEVEEEKEEEMPPLERDPLYSFVCPYCHRESYIWQCVHMPQDPSEHPRNCRHRCCDFENNEDVQELEHCDTQ